MANIALRVEKLNRAAALGESVIAMDEQESQRLAKSATFDRRAYQRSTEKAEAMRKIVDGIRRLRDQEVRKAVLAGQLPDFELRKIGTDRERFGLNAAAADIARLNAGGRN